MLWALSVSGDDEGFLAEIGRMRAAIREALAADKATLERWSIRVLTEPTLAGVLDSPKPKRAKKPAAGGKHARVNRV